jgi:hypothetical protein
MSTRIRIADGEVEYYSRAKRDGSKVRVQGRDWRVIGIVTDMMGGAATTPLADTARGARPQWWVELTEA